MEQSKEERSLVISRVSWVVTTAGVLRDRDIVVTDGVIERIEPAGMATRAGEPGRPDGAARSFEATRADATPPADRAGTSTEPVPVIDGRGHVALTGLKNAHTHAAMTLLRGYGDDMRLQPWLETRIWPAEANLTAEDVYWGTRLAALEMIRSGTTFANDMYFFFPEVWRAFAESGMRAGVGLAMFDFNDEGRRRAALAEMERHLADVAGAGAGGAGSARVFPVVAPHSIYTCSGELLQAAAYLASEAGLVYHIHMSETVTEIKNALAAHGVRPFEYLADLGVLEKLPGRVVAAHGIWLEPREIEIVAQSGVTIVHNPASNMKLASGAINWSGLRGAGASLMLGPDGVASNNNLDMFEEMRLAALMQKLTTNDPEVLPAPEALALATGSLSGAFAPWKVSGHLAPGGPADIILVDATHPQLTPMHNAESNLVYAANGSMVRTTIIDGRVVMRDGVIPGEAEVIAEASRCADALVSR